MRLDKYLKVSRIIKRRTVAKEVAAGKRVRVNGQIAKPSTEVSMGDVIIIGFGNKTVTIKVTKIQESSSKDEAHSMYQIIEEKIES